MSRIAGTLAALKANGRTALIPYVTAGFPFVDITPELMHGMVAAGADILELGVPFSDPSADGAVNDATASGYRRPWIQPGANGPHEEPAHRRIGLADSWRLRKSPRLAAVLETGALGVSAATPVTVERPCGTRPVRRYPSAGDLNHSWCCRSNANSGATTGVAGTQDDPDDAGGTHDLEVGGGWPR